MQERHSKELCSRDFSFAAGTPVHTPDGTTNIEDLRVGDEVVTWDETTGRLSTGRVTHTFSTASKPVYALVSGGETLQITGDHPVWVVEQGGWVPVSGLAVGMSILRRDGSMAPIESLELLATSVPVFNISVEGFENYFAGELGVLVHNCGAGLHHFLPRFFGNRLPKGTQYFDHAAHNQLHKKMRKYLAAPERSLPYTREIQTMLSPVERVKLARDFYKSLGDPAMVSAFRAELRQARSGGYFP